MNEETKFDIGRINALKSTRDRMLDLSDTMEELSEPTLTDLSLLPVVYGAYLDLFRQRGCPEDAGRVYNRKKFLVVTLYLYSPKALIGYRMRAGLRRAISACFGMTTSTPISDNCAGLLLLYQAYADFRRDVDIILSRVMTVIRDHSGSAASPSKGQPEIHTRIPDIGTLPLFPL